MQQRTSKKNKGKSKVYNDGSRWHQPKGKGGKGKGRNF